MPKNSRSSRRPPGDPGPAERSVSEAPIKPADWRDSIQIPAGEPFVLVSVPGNQLRANPANWRLHPESQRAAFRELKSKVGWAGVALFNLTTGQLIDGHLRAEDAGEQPVPTIVGRWTPEQEKEILRSLDPIAAMAQTDKAKLEALMHELPPLQAGDLGKMLEELAKPIDAGPGGGGAGGFKKEETEDEQEGVVIEETHAVLVKCRDESDQQRVLSALEARDFEVRALTVGFPEVEPNKEPPPPIAPGGRVIRREVAIKRTPRVITMEGQFDVPPAKKHEREWRLDWSIDGPWNIGLIVGPSGSGKSTIARELFGDRIVSGWNWPGDKSVLDGFPEGMSMPEISGLLSSVGFSSPPAWLKPFRVLSNGEQFRVNLARTLAEGNDLAVVDEFTSVVDRQVAQIGSAALAKAVRSSNRHFVAVACHYDIVDWLQPDWIVDLAKIDKHGRVPLERRSLRRRPDVEVSIRRVGTDRWSLFRPHHYLNRSLHRSAKCFLAEVDGRPAAFTAVLFNAHLSGGWWREHRTVCLPDFQGIGLGNKMSEFVASLFLATGKPYRSTTSHPSMIRHRTRSRLWQTLRIPSLAAKSTGKYKDACAVSRMTAGFEYVGPSRSEEAKALKVIG